MGSMSGHEPASVNVDLAPLATLKSINFEFMTTKDMESNACVNITEINDLISPKLGLPNTSSTSTCETCGSSSLKDCDGHFGVIKLPAPIYHPYFVPEIVEILNQICPGCKSIRDNKCTKPLSSKVLKESGDDLKLQRRLIRKFNSPTSSSEESCKTPQKTSTKSESRKNKSGCKYCHKQRNSDGWYPKVKFKSLKEKGVYGNLLVVAETIEKVPKKFRRKDSINVLPKDFWNFVPWNAIGPELRTGTKLILSPSQIFSLLKDLDKQFIEKFVSRRELLFLSSVPVTPNCQRVTEVTLCHASGPELIFDKRTGAYRNLISSKKKIEELQLQLELHPCGGGGITRIIANHSFNCLSSYKLKANNEETVGKKFDSTTPALKWIKETVLAKRSDHTVSLVVVGDPKLRLYEIGIPPDVSQRLTIAERVTSFNKNSFGKHCKSRPDIGSVFYRPLENGDIVLIHRPPSVHQHSLIAFRVKILPQKSIFSINPLCCSPLKGDFDGDMLYGCIPQSLQCRVELDQLVGLDCQLSDAYDDRSVVSLSHDSLTAAYLMTRPNVFLNKIEIQQLQMLCPRELDFPTILKSPSHQKPIWTGLQLFDALLPSVQDFALASEVSNNRGVQVSPVESIWLKNRADGVFSSLFKSYGSNTLDFLFSAQEVLCEWISSNGFSVSLHDLYICSDPYSRKKMIEEVACGLKSAESAFYMKSIMLDPEVANLFCDFHGCQDLSNTMAEDLKSKICLKLKSRFMKLDAISAYKDVFQDVQNAIHHFAEKDNSLMQMMHAGSKGSINKLFQQCICLGLQPLPNLASFNLPRISPNDCQDVQTSSCLRRKSSDAANCEGGTTLPEMIKHSFLDGLDPYECFYHAKSARSNSFGRSAEIPGTLNKKLMLHLRDIYRAYDGTVRNPYGQQVVQFPYIKPNVSEAGDDDSQENSNGLVDEIDWGGQPVGALASCSISEIAYSGMDQPTSNFKSSPLINLKMIFDGNRKSTKAGHTVSLALSKKLTRWTCGFEYAALEVQSHLERVELSEVVTTVLICYDGSDVTGCLSPWILHFHVDKQLMSRKRLNLQCILDVLERKYKFPDVTTDIVYSRLHFLIENCSFCKEARHSDTLCFTVKVECSNHQISFDYVEDTIRPHLLGAVIKGFKECSKVEILWINEPNPHRLQKTLRGELSLKVTLSEYPKGRNLWTDLQFECLHIMDLIDWERSHPDSISDVQKSFGIGCAWTYFVKNLKSSTADLGRTVHEQHICLVADSLTTTGVFCGLSPKALKLQRKCFGISSPIMHGCSYRPADTFIDAAKEKCTDCLLGTIDAMAWGKEAPVGTGGSFELLYPEKRLSDEPPKSVYEELLGNSACHENDMSANRNCSCPSNKWPPWQSFEHDSLGYGKHRGVFVSRRDGTKDEGIPNKISKKPHIQSVSRSQSDPQIASMDKRLKRILHENPLNSSLCEEDMACVMDALSFHPESKTKIGAGVEEIKIGKHPTYSTSRCFFVVRNDGSKEDFSFRKCVMGASEQQALDCSDIFPRKKHVDSSP